MFVTPAYDSKLRMAGPAGSRSWKGARHAGSRNIPSCFRIMKHD